MHILILEDDLVQQRRMAEAIEKNKDAQIKGIFISSRPEEVLERAEKNGQENIYFLDLEIRGEKRAGFQTAAKIREKDLFGAIIFVTTHSELAPVTFEYQVSALDFIAKDLKQNIFEAKVRTCLEKAVNQAQTLNNEFDYFTFKNKYCSFQVPFHELLYFETSEIPHKLRVVTMHKEMEFYADLKEVEGMDERLFCCHRSYIVNIEKVRSILKKEREVSFDGQHSCLVSRKYMKELQAALL